MRVWHWLRLYSTEQAGKPLGVSKLRTWQTCQALAHRHACAHTPLDALDALSVLYYKNKQAPRSQAHTHGTQADEEAEEEECNIIVAEIWAASAWTSMSGSDTTPDVEKFSRLSCGPRAGQLLMAEPLTPARTG